MTQKELAEKIGVTFQQIQKYESGQNRVSISTLLNICNALQVTPQFFLEDFTLQDSSTPEYEEEEHSYESEIIKTIKSIKDQQVKLKILKVVKALLEIQQN